MYVNAFSSADSLDFYSGAKFEDKGHTTMTRQGFSRRSVLLISLFVIAFAAAVVVDLAALLEALNLVKGAATSCAFCTSAPSPSFFQIATYVPRFSCCICRKRGWHSRQPLNLRLHCNAGPELPAGGRRRDCRRPHVHLDLLRLRFLTLRNRQRQHTIQIVGLDRFRIHGVG